LTPKSFDEQTISPPGRCRWSLALCWPAPFVAGRRDRSVDGVHRSHLAEPNSGLWVVNRCTAAVVHIAEGDDRRIRLAYLAGSVVPLRMPPPKLSGDYYPSPTRPAVSASTCGVFVHFSPWFDVLYASLERRPVCNGSGLLVVAPITHRCSCGLMAHQSLGRLSDAPTPFGSSGAAAKVTSAVLYIRGAWPRVRARNSAWRDHHKPAPAPRRRAGRRSQNRVTQE